MAACNEGLAVKPDHPGLLTGRGNAWLEMDRLGNAIRDYEAVLAADPKNREAAKNLRLARAKREVKVVQCLQTDGPDGVKACDAALLKGASDEFAVQKRRAGLLQAMGREKEAIEAYRVAARLNPSDGQIKQSLAALSPRSEKPTALPASEPPPLVNHATGASTVKPLPPPEKKSPIKPAAPVSAPGKAAAAVSKPPLQPPPAKAVEPSVVTKTLPAIAKASPQIEADAIQSRRYSNAPAIPGITH